MRAWHVLRALTQMCWALNDAVGVKSLWNEIRSCTYFYGLAAVDVYRYTQRGVAHTHSAFQTVMVTFQQTDSVINRHKNRPLAVQVIYSVRQQAKMPGRNAVRSCSRSWTVFFVLLMLHTGNEIFLYIDAMADRESHRYDRCNNLWPNQPDT